MVLALFVRIVLWVGQGLVNSQDRTVLRTLTFSTPKLIYRDFWPNNSCQKEHRLMTLWQDKTKLDFDAVTFNANFSPVLWEKHSTTFPFIPRPNTLPVTL